MLGMLNHQVHIEWKFRLLAHNLDNHRTERNVVDEMSVHHVAVNPVRSGFFHLSNFISQPRKVGREDGWGDDDAVHWERTFNVQPAFARLRRGKRSTSNLEFGITLLDLGRWKLGVRRSRYIL